MLKYPAILILILSLAFPGQLLTSAAKAGPAVTILVADCEAGVKIDGTTAEQTKKRIEAAGYTQVRDLKKGCDNFWHAIAVDKDGTSGYVMVSPQGQVVPESN